MKNPLPGALPTLAVDRNAATPLHKQIYDGFRTAILSGDLSPGQQIPSSRDLTSALSVSRFPVLNAYAQLLAEGYLESRVGAGTFVSASLPEQLMSVATPAGELGTASFRPASRGPPFLALSRVSILCQVARLGRLWRSPARASTSSLSRSGPISSFATPETPTPAPSTTSIRAAPSDFATRSANYLRTARGVKCDPGQIIVVSGSQQALDITARALLDPGNSVWVEEPGYPLQHIVLKAAGCRLVPVPADLEGMNVSLAMKRSPRARAAFVTPSHQYPLGSTMSASRRIQLLNWAQNVGAWVVEDDYDSEYRYESLPVPSLHGLDMNSRVIYIGTFSKVLFPSLRLGYIVAPRDLVDRFVAVRFAMDIFPPYLYQEVLTDFIDEGHFTRHLRKMRQVYGIGEQP